MLGLRNLSRVCTTCLTVAAVMVSFPQAGADDPDASIADRRLDLMRARAQSITFRATAPEFPRKLEPEPLFRYDDPTRGYVDGTVWRLGATGRPLGIITAELHPRYLGQPCIVYDLLSFSPHPFMATSSDFKWSPSGSALAVQPLNGPEPAASETGRLFQMKKLAMRFSGTQDVEGELVQLRLLPKPIDRYVPASAGASAGATADATATMFLLVNGRNPALLLILECDGTDWLYGVARLSHPSDLTLMLDGDVVWERPHATLGSSLPYNATNAPAVIPGYESTRE